MLNLADLLKRFSLSLNKDTHTKEAIAGVIMERIGINLPLENIAIKEGVLSITASGAVNNAIKLKEELILSEIRERYKAPISRILYR